MKKILALALALVMVLGLVACGGNGGTSDGPKVAVFWYDNSDAFLSTVRAEMDKEWADKGLDYQNFDAKNDQAAQIDQIKTAITNGFNILVINQVSSGSPDVAEQIMSVVGDEIPVVFFNRSPEAENAEGAVLSAHSNMCFIGTDAPEAGHMQGKMIGDYLVANYETADLNGDGVISYALFMGDKTNPEAIARTKYGVEDANAVLTAAGKPELVYFDASNTDKYQVDMGGAWSAAAATDYMNTNLAQYNDANGNMIELVICNNDNMAEGTVAALNTVGYNTGSGKYIPVFGVDATDAAKTLIADGKMTGSIKQDNVGMAVAVVATVKAINEGKTPVDAIAAAGELQDIFTVSANVANKLFVAYAPYTG